MKYKKCKKVSENDMQKNSPRNWNAKNEKTKDKKRIMMNETKFL